MARKRGHLCVCVRVFNNDDDEDDERTMRDTYSCIRDRFAGHYNTYYYCRGDFFPHYYYYYLLIKIFEKERIKRKRWYNENIIIIKKKTDKKTDNVYIIIAEVIKEIESFVATHTHAQLNPIMIGPTGKLAAGQFILDLGLFKRRRWHYLFYIFLFYSM